MEGSRRFKASGKRLLSERALLSELDRFDFVLATRNYAEACRRGDRKALGEIEVARAIRKPTVIIWVDPISRADEEIVRRAWAGLLVVYESRCIDTDESVEKAVLSIKAFLDENYGGTGS